MKKFTRNCILFLLPVLVILVSAEILLRGLPNEYKLKRHYLDEHAGAVKILCLGSSHSYYNINPAYFSLPAFNAGHSSQTLNYDWFIFDRYKDKFDSLQYLLLPVSYFSFVEKMNESTEAYRLKNYWLYYGIVEPVKWKYHTEILSIAPRKNAGRLYDYYIGGKKNIPVTALGYGTSYSSAIKNNLETMGKNAAILDTRTDHRFVRENIFYFEKIIAAAMKKNVRVVLFTSPAWRSFIENFNAGQQAQNDSIIKTTLKKYPGIIYSNYLTDSSFSAADFYDGDHLNEKGAEKFTKKLNALIMQAEKNK
jgi:hypothetical protein